MTAARFGSAWVRVLVAAVALLATGTISGCGSGPRHTISFEVIEVSLSGGGAEIPVRKLEYLYTTGGRQGPDGGDSLGAGTPLPWHRTVTVHGDLYQVTLDVDLDTPYDADINTLPTVQCQITVDGRVVMTKNWPGAVACEADQAALRSAGTGH